MKNLILTLSIFLAGASAQAQQDGTRFSCEPSTQPNGLGIERLALDLSDEDPDGMMTVTYEGAAQTLVGPVDYESDSVRYEVTPSTKALGGLSVVLIRKHGSIRATVRSDSADTFSELECEEL